MLLNPESPLKLPLLSLMQYYVVANVSTLQASLFGACTGLIREKIELLKQALKLPGVKLSEESD